jgi:CMP-N-acetylneuraminic acid synthetase
MKISAVIIARKNSTRIKKKLYQKIFGKTLIENKITQLLKANVNEVIVGSDDEKLFEVCKKYGKKVIFFKRENRFCDEKSTTVNEMVSNMLGFFKTDLVLWAHPTNPFINKNHYNEALRIFQKKYPKIDSLFSVTEINDYFWGSNKKPLNHNPQEKTHTLLSTKKIKPLFVDNGGIFIREHKKMIKDGRFWGKKGEMYVMNIRDGWDINTQWDLEACQLKSFFG